MTAPSYTITTRYGTIVAGPFACHLLARKTARMLNMDCKRRLLIVRDDGALMGFTVTFKRSKHWDSNVTLRKAMGYAIRGN